jgi:hypothetical protein
VTNGISATFSRLVIFERFRERSAVKSAPDTEGIELLNSRIDTVIVFCVAADSGVRASD